MNTNEITTVLKTLEHKWRERAKDAENIAVCYTKNSATNREFLKEASVYQICAGQLMKMYDVTAQLQKENEGLHRKLARFMVVFNRLNSENAAAWVALQAPENEINRDLSNAEKRSVEAWQQVIRIGELVNRSVSHEIESEVARLVSENIQLQAEKSTIRESALREAIAIIRNQRAGMDNNGLCLAQRNIESLITTPASECECKPDRPPPYRGKTIVQK